MVQNHINGLLTPQQLRRQIEEVVIRCFMLVSQQEKTERQIHVVLVSEAVYKWGGTFEVNKNKVAKSFGLTIGASVEVSASKTSAPLAKGEYIKAYYRLNWKQWTVKQGKHCYVTRYSFDSNGNPTGIKLVDEGVVARATGYLYRPIMPQIKLEYHKGSSARAMSVPYKTEEYVWNGKEYVLSDIKLHG